MITQAVDLLESERLRKRFVTHARGLAGVRIAIVLLGALYLVVNHREALSWLWLAGIIIYTGLAHRLAGHLKYGRWAFFVTLCLDLIWATCFIVTSAGLESPLMPIVPLYTFLFALLFPSPFAVMPPLALLPIITSMSHQPDFTRLVLYATINAVVIYLTNFILSREEQQSRQILELEHQLKKLAVVEERTRLSREIHDGVGGSLSGIILQCEAQTEIEEIKSTAEGAMDELRRTLAMMQNEFELVPQLQNYCRTISTRHQLPVHIHIQGEAPALSHEQQLSLFRILQESLTNVAKHARAHCVNVQITFSTHTLEMNIRDDGIGFDPDATPKHHYGLANLHERAKKMGGEVIIETQSGFGTNICFKQAFAIASGV